MITNISIWKILLTEKSVRIEKLEIPDNVTTLDQVSLQIPFGAYTTFRTYESNKVVRLEVHFARLERTSRLVDQPQTLDWTALRSAIRMILERISYAGDLRVRLTLDLDNVPGTIYLSAQILKLPPAILYQSGVQVVTNSYKRQQPKAKLSRSIASLSKLRENLPDGIFEGLLINPEGLILEGSSSNFFAIKNNQIFTAEKGVLCGTTRKLVLDCIDRLGLDLILNGISCSELPELTEAFLSSASRGILPVTQIDNFLIGEGKPGKRTIQIMAEFQGLIREELEPI